MVRKNFTLVEILVVLGLMAVLLFIALPSFEKLAKGHGVSLAARNIVSKLGLARGYAVSTRQYTALLFYQADVPASGSTPEGTSEKTKYFNKSYRICSVSKYIKTAVTPNEARYYFNSWIQGENWDYAPNGVVILEVNDQPDVHLDASSLLDPQNTVKKNGTANSAFFTKIFFTLSDATDDANTGSNTAYVPGIAFNPSGKMAFATGTNSSDSFGDKYVKIGEGTYSGNALVITNKGSTSYETNKVDQFTGRVTYGSQ